MFTFNDELTRLTKIDRKLKKDLFSLLKIDKMLPSSLALTHIFGVKVCLDGANNKRL